MARCTACGALLGPDAEWCGQCYALVRSPEPEQPGASVFPTLPAQAPPVSHNGASGGASPATAPSDTAPVPALAPGVPAIPPDLLITLASGSSNRVSSLGDRGKVWLSSLIVLVAAGSDALFFPYVKYMLVYGIFVSVVSGLAISRVWARRSVNR